MGIVDKIQDKLSGNKHNEPHQTHGTTTTGTHVGQEPVGAHSGTHSNSGLTGNPTNTSSGLTSDHHTTGSNVGGTHNTDGLASSHITPGSHSGSNLPGAHNATTGGLTSSHNTPGSGLTGSHNNGLNSSHHNAGTGLTGSHNNGLNSSHHNAGSGITGGTAVHGDHTYSHAGHPQHADFVPGSHPSAQNPSAVPTAGGERVGSIPGGNGPYPDTHGSHGVYDNRSGMEKIKDKVVPSRTDRPDDPITGQNYGQSASSNVSGHHQSGLGGSHSTSAATPLAHDSAFNDRHSGPGHASNTHSSGLSSNNHSGPGFSGTGLSGTGHANQGTHLGSHDQYAAGGVDNRSGMEKIKDKAIPSRNDRPDDALTGQNYGQTSGTSNYATGAHTSSHVPGTAHSGQGSHFAGNQTYGSGVGSVGSNQHHGAGVGGVGHSGAYESTPSTGLGGHSTTHGTTTTTHTTTTTKPSLMDKLNPKKDADHDGKAGFMD